MFSWWVVLRTTFITLTASGLLLQASLCSAQINRSAATSPLYYQWQQLLSSTRSLSETKKLQRINSFFNEHIQFGNDADIWQSTDYWATPLETMLRGAGDCEDFTIAKYITLLESGVSSEKLRLVYVKARIGIPESSLQQAHMVLAYYPENTAEPLILDNLTPEIRNSSRRPDLIPLFSFNSEGIWVTGRAVSDSPGDHLSNWQAVLKRMDEEGLYTGGLLTD